jgi:hypothetical protein
MTTEIIDPNYQWKQAASQEGVDYGAVQKSFMDQSYAIVANKAKILFQDPFRLGFEIVHRNEKATKMVGIFAFRVNSNLLYAPVFFVNGEIKAADMLYRTDVKRFVPLTEDWCAYLVRGNHESAGEPVDRNRYRQADAYMDRLAYPQRVKYAADRLTLADINEKADAETREYLAEKYAGDKQSKKPGAEDVETHADAEIYESDDEVHEAIASGKQNRHLMSDELADKAITGLKLDHIEEKNLLTREQLRDLMRHHALRVTTQKKENAPHAEAFKKAAADGSIWRELMLHSADDAPMRKLLPLVIDAHGPEALEKLAAFIGNSPGVAAAVASNYTKEDLETVNGWLAKEASGPRPAISIILSPELAKSAAQRERIFDKGYDLVDHRLADSVNTVIEEVGAGTIKELSSPGKVQLLMANGDTEEALLLRESDHLLFDNSGPSPCGGSGSPSKIEYAYFPSDKQLFRLPSGEDVFGDETIDQDTNAKAVTGDAISTGKCYVALDTRDLSISRPFHVADIAKDGECSVITISIGYGDQTKLFYAPGRGETSGRYLSDETFFLEVDCDVKRDDDDGVRKVEPKCTRFPMSSAGVEQWMRTAGGITTANEVTVRPKAGPTFDVEHREDGTLLKAARNLGWLEAHLALAEDFSLRTDVAGKILNKAVDGDVTYRIFDSVTKQAYLTRPEGMEQWVQSFDPELNVRLDAPQQQILSTHTPRRPDQQSRYGDTYQGPRGRNSETAESLLPMDMIMNSSPEELAQMSSQYGMPHILDHGAVSQMATTSHGIVDQIKLYIPDFEAGVDRYFRTLFLLRYRPADFEEIYGKEDLIDFEQELAELATRAGENLLRMLQQFKPDQYSAQEN